VQTFGSPLLKIKRFPITDSAICESSVSPACDFPDSPLKPIQSFRRYDALDLWTGTKAEAEKLPLLRSRYRTLCLIYLEFEFVCDEMRNTLHHPLTCPLAANVDITVIRIANETKSTAL
jgi:hypothetical protein